MSQLDPLILPFSCLRVEPWFISRDNLQIGFRRWEVILATECRCSSSDWYHRPMVNRSLDFQGYWGKHLFSHEVWQFAYQQLLNGFLDLLMVNLHFYSHRRSWPRFDRFLFTVIKSDFLVVIYFCYHFWLTIFLKLFS